MLRKSVQVDHDEKGMPFWQRENVSWHSNSLPLTTNVIVWGPHFNDLGSMQHAGV